MMTMGEVIKRIVNVLLPTVVMFLAYVWCYFGSFEKLAYCAMGEYKWGYWFTFALTLMAVLHWMVSVVAGRVGKNRAWIVVLGLIGVSVLLIGVRSWDCRQNDFRLSGRLSLRLLAMYFPAYVAGVAAKTWQERFHKFVNNEWIATMVCIGFVAMLLQRHQGFYAGLLQGLLGVFLLYRIAYFYRGVFSEQTFVGRQLMLMGRCTLPIYLLHYFVLLGLKLPDAGSFVDGEGRWALSSLLTLTLTLLIAYTCVGIAWTFSAIRPLHRLLLGK